MGEKVRKIAVTGACGQIAYSLLFAIASGALFGPKQKVDLHLLDVEECLERLKGVEMELQDCAFPLLNKVYCGSVAKEIFAGADTVFLLGSKPRTAGMERKYLIAENGSIFLEQGKALHVAAHPNATVLVVGNPCNTNCLIAQSHAKNCNFYSMTQLDHNRTVSLLARKAHVLADDVQGVTIWGNHSALQVPDLSYATICHQPVRHMIQDETWLEQELMITVQQRGAKVIEARGKSSAASAAKAAIDSMKALLFPTLSGQWFSAGILSDTNPYGVSPGLIFSFPCYRSVEGKVKIVPGFTITPELREKMQRSEKELLEERQMAQALGLFHQ